MSTWDVVAGAQHVALCWREVPADCQVDASRQSGHLKSEPAQTPRKFRLYSAGAVFLLNVIQNLQTGEPFRLHC